MKNLIPRCIGLAVLATAFAVPQFTEGQIIISLPTVRTFNVNTTVMVPDGGQMLLGGVKRGSYGSVTRGVPGLSNLSGANRLFKNRGIGQSIGSSTGSVTPRIIIAREQEAEVMAVANQRARARIAKNRNLDPKVVRQAERLSRSIGRRR